MCKEIMKCWICGNEATTGEHKIKHSDLKNTFSNVSQETPLFHRKNGIVQRYIRSLKSNSLKFDALICAKCNNERTQKFDLAWTTLSNYLQENWDTILKDGQINLLDIFPTNTTQQMIEVQLFFVKIFGCSIKETSTEISLSTFSKSILCQLEHPSIYFSFRESEMETVGGYVVMSDIEVYYEKNNLQNIYYIHMFFTLNQVAVDLIYCPNKAFVELNGAIKPSQIVDDVIELSKLSYKSTLPEYIQSNMKKNKDIAR